MRSIFLGTPQFAVPTLERMIAAGHQIRLVVTQPDRPKGRGNSVAMPPVKQAALRHGLEVFQPERVRRSEAVERLRAIAPEIMVIVGYGQIIPQAILDIAPHGILNVHASLLPKYRGAAPIQWAIANGEISTGVTIMKIDAGLDTGDILQRAETAIGDEETALELSPRLAQMGADLLVETLAQIAAQPDLITPEKQDNSAATYAPILKKEDGAIDWNRSAREIHNRFAGCSPGPARIRFSAVRLCTSGSRPSPAIPHRTRLELSSSIAAISTRQPETVYSWSCEKCNWKAASVCLATCLPTARG